MKTGFCWIGVVLLAIGCSTAHSVAKGEAVADYEQNPDAVVGYLGDAPTMAQESAAAAPSRPSLKKAKPSGSLAQSMDDASIAPGNHQEGASDNQSNAERVHTPLVIYNGYLKLRVRRVIETVDAITKITKKNQGYVESVSERVVVVRIPGSLFEQMMSDFARLGDVLDQNVQAVEVTNQYHDLEGRLAIARAARERLLILLNQEQKPKRRLAILQEIKRLSEQIESDEARLRTLQSLLDYFTITIEMEPIINAEQTAAHQSPFEWVRHLSPHRATLTGAKKLIGITLPSNFVLFDEDKEFHAQAADTTVLRAGVTINNPMGDSRFWADAIDYEMKGRGELLETSASVGNLVYHIYRNDDPTPRFYLVGTMVVGDQVVVIEVFFPNKSAFDKHGQQVQDALNTLEVK